MDLRAITHNFYSFFQVQTVKNSCVRGFRNETLGFVAGILTFVVEFLLPLIILCFLYCRIWLRLRHQESAVNKQISQNVVKTMAIVSLAFVICLGPNKVIYFYGNIGGVVDWKGVSYRCSVVSSLANMCINPFIYAFHYQDFRSKLTHVFILRCCVPQESAEVPLVLQKR